MSESDRDGPAITELLRQWRGGDENAFSELTNYVYGDLRRRASSYLRAERPEHTLQSTGLVHEAVIKLIGKENIDWADRNHFFAVAAQAMRRILVDHARARSRRKRGGNVEELPLDEAMVTAVQSGNIDLAALDEALDQLATFDKRLAQVVELKYFGGMTNDETADILGVSRETVKRDWEIARAWLRQWLE